MSGAAPTAGPPRQGGAGAKAFVQRNKVPLAVAGAAGVAGLALLRSRQGSGEKGSATTAAGTGRLAATGGVYDSSSSDAYNALQPAIEKVSNQYDDLKSWLQDNGVGKPPTPVPAPEGGAATPDLVVADPAPRPSSAPATVVTDYGRGTPLYTINWGQGDVAASTGDVSKINQGYSVPGLSGSQMDAIKDGLASKGLFSDATRNSGGYTEESAGGRVVQGYR